MHVGGRQQLLQLQRTQIVRASSRFAGKAQDMPLVAAVKTEHKKGCTGLLLPWMANQALSRYQQLHCQLKACNQPHASLDLTLHWFRVCHPAKLSGQQPACTSQAPGARGDSQVGIEAHSPATCTVGSPFRLENHRALSKRRADRARSQD